MTEHQSIVATEGLTKSFGAVRALDGVSLDFAAGEVHGLVGENGAGKSTLVKIISGLYEPTRGRVLYRGEPRRFKHPAEAMRLGVAMVHQELNLIDDLTVAENIVLGREISAGPFLRRKPARRLATKALAEVGCGVSPEEPVGRLSMAQKQMVEIARAVSCDASLVIMDEPTAVLTRDEVRRLFELIDRLKRRGVTVVYISHILPEVLALCDRITVMRDGAVVRTLSRGEIGAGPAAEAQLGTLMVGRPMEEHFPPAEAAGEPVVLDVRDVALAPAGPRVSLRVRAGEVLGIAGLIGAGRTEWAEALAGLRPRYGGQVTVNGRSVRPGDPRQAVAAGVAYVSEDRRGRGLVMGRPIVENITLASLRRFSRGLLKRRAERAAAAGQVERLRIRIGRLGDAVDTLSGGNQQKVSLAKWLLTEPRVLLLDEPTRGIDVGAKEEIYRLIRQMSAAGLACVMISSELNELLGMSHRIAVMRDGRIAAELSGEQMNEETVMLYAAGVKKEALA